MINNFTLRILKIYHETIVDGPGLRYSIYFSGCEHKCPGCHNIDSWNCQNGTLLTQTWLDQITNEINSNILLDGITLSGGDPLFKPKEMFLILKYLKEKTNQNILCYTGYTINEIENDPLKFKCLSFIDTLIEGRFIKELYSPHLRFKGSSNQNIINISRYKKNE